MTRHIIYKDLSYKIVGILYEVYNQLGSYYHEKYYQRAIEKLLMIGKIDFEREKRINILINDIKIGNHYADFVIENKVLLEIKKGNTVRDGDVRQVLMYLNSSNIKLGILAYFGTNGVTTKRIINSKIRAD